MVHWTWLIVAFLASPVIFLLWLAMQSDERCTRADDEFGANRP